MRKLIITTAMIVASVAVAAGAEERPECAVLARTFAIPDSNLPDIKVEDATVTLIGEPGSKSIGLSFKAAIDPTTELNGSEKLLLYLYVTCDAKSPSETSGINVGIVEVGALPQGNKKSTVVTSKESSALVALRDIRCVKLGLG